MNDDANKLNPYLLQLVYSLQAAAMQQMGKVMNPMTGKIERNIALAQNSIDMLAMIDEKTKGNLSAEEEKLIAHILYELRLNFLDESKKKEPESSGSTENKDSKKTDNSEKE